MDYSNNEMMFHFSLNFFSSSMLSFPVFSFYVSYTFSIICSTSALDCYTFMHDRQKQGVIEHLYEDEGAYFV